MTSRRVSVIGPALRDTRRPHKPGILIIKVVGHVSKCQDLLTEQPFGDLQLGSSHFIRLYTNTILLCYEFIWWVFSVCKIKIDQNSRRSPPTNRRRQIAQRMMEQPCYLQFERIKLHISLHMNKQYILILTNEFCYISEVHCVC